MRNINLEQDDYADTGFEPPLRETQFIADCFHGLPKVQEVLSIAGKGSSHTLHLTLERDTINHQGWRDLSQGLECGLECRESIS